MLSTNKYILQAAYKVGNISSTFPICNITDAYILILMPKYDYCEMGHSGLGNFSIYFANTFTDWVCLVAVKLNNHWQFENLQFGDKWKAQSTDEDCDAVQNSKTSKSMAPRLFFLNQCLQISRMSFCCFSNFKSTSMLALKDLHLIQ